MLRTTQINKAVRATLSATCLSVTAMGALSFAQHSHAATYQLEELPQIAEQKHVAGSVISDNGVYLFGRATGRFNFPIDFSEIDVQNNGLQTQYFNYVANKELADKTVTFTLEDIEAGNINAEAFTFLYDYLLASYRNILQNNANISSQPIMDERLVQFKDGQSVLIDGLDETRDYLDGEYSFSVSMVLEAVSNSGVAVGYTSAPMSKVLFQADASSEEITYYERDFHQRGLLVTPAGEMITLLPPFSELGGVSRVHSVVETTDGYLAYGSASVGFYDTIKESLDDACTGETRPASVCVDVYRRGNLYDMHAYEWQLDSDFNVVGGKDLGVLAARGTDDNFSEFATAMASNGTTVVGSSRIRNDDGDLLSYNGAVVFSDAGNMRIDNDGWFRAEALAVNANGQVLGEFDKSVERRFVSKPFVYDIASETVTEYESFFTSSRTTVKALNDNGFAVGFAEAESSLSGGRRNEAFLLDLTETKITNINSLLPCTLNGENYPYTVVSANDIDNNNVIIGTAVKTQDRRDAFGTIVKDENGEVEKESVTVAVKLTPNANGEVETCPPDAAFDYERQGASFSWLALLLLPLVGLRRRLRAW